MLRFFKYVGITIVAVILVIIVAVWWRVHSALPKYDGTVKIPDLKSEATIRRDNLGVPHITAQSIEDLSMAQGYAMAQDRLWQMDLLRRAAAGRLSEILGPVTLETDRTFRRLGLSEAAGRDVALLEPDERVELEAFARGVNQFIEERHTLPIEFALLRYEPEPWRPADTLLIVGYMYQTLTSSWRSDLNRLDTSVKLGKERGIPL